MNHSGLKQALKSQETRLDLEIKAKMNLLQGRMKKLRTEELIETLNTIRDEKITNPVSLNARLNEVKQVAQQAKERIAEADKKLVSLNQVSKLLISYNNYLPTAQQV